MATVTKPMALDETLQATNEILDDIKDALANSSIVGDTDISAIADGTLTGAVAEFDGDISTINTTLAGLGDAATKDVANTYNAESTDPISGQGVAEALETQEVESLSDTTPYLYRQSPAIGTRVMENVLVGASIVKNQLVQNGDFADGTTGWSATRGTISASNNTLTYTVSELHSGDGNYIGRGVTFVSGHKYLCRCKVKVPRATTIRFSVNGVYNQNVDIAVQTANTWVDVSGILSCTAVYSNLFVAILNTSGTSYSVGDTVQFQEITLKDLTQWFGSDSIPNNAYTKEQSTAGSGIAWLKEQGHDFSKYIPHNTGTLESVNPTAKKVVGKNLFNKALAVNTRTTVSGEDIVLTTSGNYQGSAGVEIKAITDTFLCVSGTIPTGCAIECYFTDDDGNTTASTVVVSTSGSVISIGNVGTTKVTMFLGNRTSGAGTFVFKNIQVEFVASTTSQPTPYTPYEEHTYAYPETTLRGLFELVGDEIKANGDIYESSGKVTRNYEYRAYQSGDESLADAITDGTHTVVKLATPTTESLAPFDNPQISIVGGTEEFVTDNDVPVGHQSEYKKLPPIFEDDYIQTIQERAENVIEEIEAVTPISGTATVTLLHEEDQGEDWIVGFTGEINGHFDTDHFDYYLTARYTHAYNTNTQILNMNSCSDGDYVNIWQTGTLDFSVDGGVTVDISVTATTLTFAVNCIGDSVFGIYSSSETTGEVKYLITPARKG